MKNIVIYESGTGFTAQYAQWIAGELCCECRALKAVTARELAEYDAVIFGGWVMGNGICGWDRLARMGVRPAAVYAVGSTPAFEEVTACIREQNKLGELPFFYLTGGFRFEQLGLGKRLLLKALKKAVAKKERPSRQEAFMAQALGASFDHSGKEQIAPLVEFLRGAAPAEGR